MNRNFQKLAIDSVEQTYDDRMMNKTAESNTRASKRELEKEKLVFNNVSELLECPVCVTTMSAPIYQCPNGHTLCSMCKSRVEDYCPICRTDMGSIRCLALEKAAKALEVPYDCPCHDRGCRATGNIPELVTHLKNIHYAKLVDGCEIKANFIQPLSNKMSITSWRLHVYSCYGCYFCLYLKGFSFGNTIGHVAYLRFMGEENKAKKFCYSLEIDREDQELTYHGVPRSTRVCNDNFFNDGVVVFPSFWEENKQKRRLILTGHISYTP